jgi:tRNA(Ile)-lysidine synthase
MLHRFRAALGRLAPRGSTVLLAVSGGPDSQALLDLAARVKDALGLRLFAAGVDHGLRAEAARELDLAAALADSHGIPFARLRVTVPGGGNLLAQARRARYAALRRHAREVGARRIALAHTATDQVETVLMRLARGSALRGAAGIPERRGSLVRPLLGIDRPAIERYLNERGIPFATDPSNADPRRARARLRASVLPTLAGLNPGFAAQFARFARLARADERLLARLAARELVRAGGALGSLDTAVLGGLEAPLLRRVLAAWLAAHEIPVRASWLARLRAGLRQGELAATFGGKRVRLDGGRLWVESEAAGAEMLPLPVPGRLELPELGLALVVRVKRSRAKAELPQREVAFDADRLHLGLSVRRWRSGDTLAPFGLRGHVRVGDLFTNQKMPQLLRPHWPLLVSGDDVAWVVGLRRGSLAPITPATRRVLTVEVEGALPWSAC